MEEKDRKNRIRFEFEARSQNESLARSVAAAYVLPLDPTVEEVTEIKTAVSEAVSNAIIHAYPGKEETGGKEKTSGEAAVRKDTGESAGCDL